MKRTGKIIALALTVFMLAGAAGMAAASAPEENGGIVVSLRVEGIEEPLYYNREIRLAAESTVTELLAEVNLMEDGPEIAISDSGYGAYISAIDSLEEFAFGAMSGWSYRVNGLSPTFGIDQCVLEDGDEVVCFYGDPFGIGMQYPAVDISRLFSDGIVKFTSVDATYDEDWNEILTENPVAAAIVSFDGDPFTTNDDGEIALADTAGIAGFHKLQIERYDEETGVPTVLRLAPDFEIYVPFADTPDDAWYTDAVMYCVRDGYLVGTDLALNLFAPQDYMRTPQLITVLARIAGLDRESTTGGDWYRAPLEWAVVNHIVDLSDDDIAVVDSVGGIDAYYRQIAMETVTRQEFIRMFCLTAEYAVENGIGVYDMTLRADITGATDYDLIDEGALEAVSWAVAAGIIMGTDSEALTIDPAYKVSRAVVCRMLLNYYS